MTVLSFHQTVEVQAEAGAIFVPPAAPAVYHSATYGERFETATVDKIDRITQIFSRAIGYAPLKLSVSGIVLNVIVFFGKRDHCIYRQRRRYRVVLQNFLRKFQLGMTENLGDILRKTGAAASRPFHHRSSSMTTPQRSTGAFTGTKPIKEAQERVREYRLIGFWLVPVFPAMATWVIAAFFPVPFSTTSCNIRRRRAATVSERTRRTGVYDRCQQHRPADR